MNIMHKYTGRTINKCGNITFPNSANFKIIEFVNINITFDWSEITFYCESGITTTTVDLVAAVCRGTEVWSDKPGINNTECQYIRAPQYVNYCSVQYQCENGFTPEGTITTVCKDDGLWTPHPTEVNCVKDDDHVRMGKVHK